jgi:4-carboxymuconolactone decarboxylase
MLYAPRLGLALQALGAAVRFETSLSDRVRELAILLVAAERDSDFERFAHEAIGRRVGLTDAEMRAVRDHATPDLSDPVELSALAVTQALLATGDLDDAQYRRALEHLSVAALLELTTLVGYYSTLALQLRVFRVSAPDVDGQQMDQDD